MHNFNLSQIDFDGRPLHGLSSGLDRGRIVIHVHGTWGNFYENQIATAFAQHYETLGYGFATVNIPGHDAESQQESFGESLPALSQWANHLLPRGEIVWQGHSLGALKIMRYLADGAEGQTATSKAAILLSPFDLAAFYAQSSDSQVASRKLDTAEDVVRDGRGDLLVPPDLFDVWPVSYHTYAAALERGGILDVFPTANSETGLLNSIDLPVFVGVGSEDFALIPSPQTVLDLVREDAPSCRVAFVQGAPHNFAGYEHDLGNELTRFVKDLL
jgi:pimeloyl-ACP methyl ester carboxylesterase